MNNNENTNNQNSNNNEEKLYNTQSLLKVTPEPKKSLYSTIVIKLDNIIKKNNSLKSRSIKKVTNVEHKTHNVVQIIKGRNLAKKEKIKINVDSRTFFLQQRNLCIVALDKIINNIDEKDKNNIRKHSRKIDVENINNIHINKTNYNSYREKLTEYATKKMYNQYAPRETTKYKIYKYSFIMTSIVFVISLLAILNWVNQGIKSKGTISPIYSQAVTSRQGLEDNGTIKTSNDNSDHGNSGGPVLTMINGKLKVVGILSGANKGSDSMKGRVVPIGAAFN